MQAPLHFRTKKGEGYVASDGGVEDAARFPMTGEAKAVTSKPEHHWKQEEQTEK